jgi:tRNA-2-methylthio-N6-dimethylallyladenosine synthase
MERDVLIEKAPKKLFIESYGCAMNFADSEVVASIMAKNGVETIQNEEEADIIFINTCSIRDNAEQRIRHRLKALRHNKKNNKDLTIGILGCMAERLKKQLLEEEKLVDIVAGPDAYRDLPILLSEVEDGRKAMNVILSLEETYAEIQPTRLNSNGVTAYISIMRGCDNMCTFCVVPFTRGRERSRSPESILSEVKGLVDQGYKEVTLLGQNVDSYLWYGGGPKKNFDKLTETEKTASVNFAQLLELTARVSPEMRIRFSTSHPKDITDDVLYTMLKYDNICNYIHLPAQSGNSRILEKMNRTYDREWYDSKLSRIRELIPDCGVSCDIITGFCSETDSEHRDTLDLMRKAEFDFSYMYFYSERPGTLAARKFEDDVPEELKKLRLSEVIAIQNEVSQRKNREREGKVFRVLIEGESKKSPEDLMGRTDQNIVCIFPREDHKKGEYVNVLVERSTTTSLIGRVMPQ